MRLTWLLRRARALRHLITRSCERGAMVDIAPDAEMVVMAERTGDAPPAMRAPVRSPRVRDDEWAAWRCENCGLLAGVHMDTAEACPRCRRGSFVGYPPAGPVTEHERKRHGAPPRHRRDG